MSDQYTSLVDVTVPPGGSVTVPHNLVANGAPAAPHVVQPNVGTDLVVSAVTTTTVTVSNPGTMAASARFLCAFLHSIQSRPIDVPAGSMAWQGGGAGGGALAPLQNTVIVAKNGNDATADGSVALPFLTVQAGMEYAWATYVQPLGPQPAPPFTRPQVYVCAGTYDDGPLVLPPQVFVCGAGGNASRLKGDWSIDARWSNAGGPDDYRSGWNDVGLFGSVVIDWDLYQSSEGKLWVQGTRFAGGGTLLLQQKTSNPTSNQAYFQGCEFDNDVTLNANNVTMEGALFTTDPGGVGATLTLNRQGGSSDNFFSSYGGTIGNVVVNALVGAPDYNVRLGHAAQSGATLTLNGAFSTVYADASALPLQSLIVLAGGATLAQILRVNRPNFAGNTAGRPAFPEVGDQYYDTALPPTGLPIWWDGTQWTTAAGVPV
jgi:hypothetical protein